LLPASHSSPTPTSPRLLPHLPRHRQVNCWDHDGTAATAPFSLLTACSSGQPDSATDMARTDLPWAFSRSLPRYLYLSPLLPKDKLFLLTRRHSLSSLTALHHALCGALRLPLALCVFILRLPDRRISRWHTRSAHASSRGTWLPRRWAPLPCLARAILPLAAAPRAAARPSQAGRTPGRPDRSSLTTRACAPHLPFPLLNYSHSPLVLKQ